ncbi:MAG: transglutaminase domain-containing protein, partial [Lachnospiraceae bacterium]|nr:transglutaminase domain-containing protein [Lachnospiraceae bacterium]
FITMISVLMYMLFSKVRSGRAETALILFYLLITAAEEIQIRRKKEGEVTLSQHITFVLPFPVLVLVLLLLFKAPQKPYDWGFVKKAVNTAKAVYQEILVHFNMQNGWDSDNALMGFSDEGGLGGRVGNSSYPALSLETDRKYEGRIYLSGKTFDSFDGREWTKTDESEIDGRTYDLILTMAALLQYDPDHFADYIQSFHTTVGYLGVRTPVMFIPLKMLPPSGDVDLQQKGEDLKTAGKKNRFYRVSGYRVNRGLSSFEEFLQDHDDVDRKSFFEAEVKVFNKDRPEYSFEGLSEYESRVFEIYGKDPEVSDKMNSYLEEIMDGAESDAGKLSLLEETLSEMKYDTNPGRMPDEVQNSADFLDYMMLDKKAGYCMHYATAFVLLSRALGIPARFVQGYSVKMNGRKCEIKSSDAHAWPEVYIRGAGWMVYEPTPGFRSVMSWDTAGEGSKEASAYGSYYAEKYANEVSDNEPEEITADVREKAPDLKVFIIPLVSVVVFLILFFVADRMVRRFRYSRMDEREKIVYCALRSMKMLKRSGIVPEKGETVSQFCKRAQEKIPEEFLEHFAVYEKALYAADAPGWKDVNLAENGMKELAGYLRKIKTGRLSAVLFSGKLSAGPLL